jgi:hypothetical protein
MYCAASDTVNFKIFHQTTSILSYARPGHHCQSFSCPWSSIQNVKCEHKRKSMLSLVQSDFLRLRIAARCLMSRVYCRSHFGMWSSFFGTYLNGMAHVMPQMEPCRPNGSVEFFALRRDTSGLIGTPQVYHTVQWRTTSTTGCSYPRVHSLSRTQGIKYNSYAIADKLISDFQRNDFGRTRLR